MPEYLPVTAASRSVALRFQPDSDLLAGSFLRLISSPDASATARTIEGSELTAASATARGIGTGYSRYYEGLVDESFFNSKNLSIASGGGQIDGNAVASAFASGRGDISADALATNIGLANLSYLDRYGGALLIGSSANPFTASATAGSGSVLGPLAGSTPTNTLNATAVVRGLEGSASNIAPAFRFYGQPNAVVAATAELTGGGSGTIQGNASADAKGIDSYEIKAVPFGNGDGTATITGDAAARLALPRLLNAASDSVTLNGNAVGIDGSLIYGAPTLNTTITGKGVASVDGDGSDALQLEQLKGIGISNSFVFTNQGNDVVRGFGGIAAPQLSLAAAIDADTAGIDATGMYTGLGNDVIFGKILNEVETDLDADGNGLLEEEVFLDRSAQDGSIGGFDGIRNSYANTGIGNDLIAGSSNGSHFNAEIGNDSIDLDRAKGSSLWGGIGNDLLRIGGAEGSGGPSLNNVLWGGIGNDNLQVGSGDGSVLDGGYGQDITTGGTGVDRFVLSEGGAALLASSNSYLGEDLADQPLWASLSQTQKETLWDTGQLLNSAGTQLLGQLDTIRNFQAGNGGDVLEISNSLASITEELWLQKGAIFGVNSTGNLTVQEASADGTNRVGVVVGTLADIQRLGMGSPSIGYATDTRQLMFDADGNWSQGAISLGTVNVAGGSLTKSNFAFGSTTGNGLGEAPTAQGGVG
ncbi:hypothetical protein KBY85_10545 [Cyanobium sp. BA5m-10]|uniref:hypothetical protein n=1 Tax=Cyanobium sp. BA5m-10 TaxID=2823705 RepID=UPI0020CCC34D|nr:hypothetical protein [Cyanobium sp. BA5m-10]MCP9904569.1 hypothetical protein [Cyanobium sp. BA5m-10]